MNLGDEIAPYKSGGHTKEDKFEDMYCGLSYLIKFHVFHNKEKN